VAFVFNLQLSKLAKHHAGNGLYLPFIIFPMEQNSQIPVFFIIGRPRTGTTLLQSLLDAHPNVVIPWECQFVLNLYPLTEKLRIGQSDHLKTFTPIC
jgi:hypothetical protein